MPAARAIYTAPLELKSDGAVLHISRRAGTPDALCGCDRRTYLLPLRGEARDSPAACRAPKRK